jgi:hypothetical protein
LMTKTEVPNRFQATTCSSRMYLSNATYHVKFDSNWGGK